MMKRRLIYCTTLICSFVLFALAYQGFLSSSRASAQSLGGPTAIGPSTTQQDWRNKVNSALLSKAALGPTEFIVYMAQTADLSGASKLSTKEAKGRYVYTQLTTAAQASQPNVVRTLNQLHAEHKDFWVANVIWAKGNLAVVQAVASLPEVASITPTGTGGLRLPPQKPIPTSTNSTQSPSLTNAAQSPTSPNLVASDPNPEQSLVSVNADKVWAMGIEGQGVVVAGADTGVRWTHTALKNRYRGWNGSVADHNYNWHDGIPNPNDTCPGSSPEPCDDDNLLGGGHGSHTVGTMVGDDGGTNRIGMAPQAKWIACRNMNHGVGAPVTGYLECMQFFLAPTKIDGSAPDPSKAPHVINNSWGCVEPGCAPEPNPPVPGFLRATLQASRAAGIVYVVSAGNEGNDGTGDCSTLQFPLARYPEAFSVGATDHRTDTIADFSSRGPVMGDPDFPTGLRKPDISAPGVGIRSVQRASDTSYGSLSGTSMSGPHVAGLVALIISANPALAGNVDRIEEIIEQTAVRKTTSQACGSDTSTTVPNNVYGWGRIDALAAVQKALEGVNTSLTNYALTVRGSVASASSVYSGRNYSASSAFDGERTGADWEQGGGWNDDTRDVWPDTLEVAFGGGAKTVSEIRVYTLQNNFNEPVVPDETTDASVYGIQDFDVQTWNGTSWVTVPNGQITGNTKAMRVITLATPVSTTKVRVVVNMGRVHFSRIVELEAYGAAGQ
jgi:serine protease AprX